ncbi:probable lysophospholipase BODYGUARD 3 [Impatiens glandulifera]|uniref:probable lysophospholipase BODYGUARD 3 n=1 Tax=Impatiens glandulifera TaxID=253017 RepID=UPI001FB17DE0|nr:probable lysophospholipase BODYGUARD 3 [Impatiens glandulifera]
MFMHMSLMSNLSEKRMIMIKTTRSALTLFGRFIINNLLSFIIFSLIDILDFILCYVYKFADYLIETESKPCYCSPVKETITTSRSGNILVSESGQSKIFRFSSTRIQLNEISDTLYVRPTTISELSKGYLSENEMSKIRSTFAVDSPFVEMLQEKIIGVKKDHRIPRWSDCDCNTCNSWASSSSNDSLFVRVEGANKRNVQEDVLFIHGYISSSSFWTETLFPNFSKSAKSTYRMFAVDLLGFGRSPKPDNSLYTIGEHLEMIEKSVINPYQVKSFHIVAHSLGCILALALAIKHPDSIKSITLLAPPYFPAPKGEKTTHYLMKRLAPRQVWPPIAFGASLACWYEHVGRTICLVICKNHQKWNSIIKFITRNRIKTYLIDGFCCHTHNSAWHTLHNIICGTAEKVDDYLNTVRSKLNCPVSIFHGQDDDLIPIECSYHVQTRIPRARVKIVENKDHITIVLGRQKAFAMELEEIWKSSKSSN